MILFSLFISVLFLGGWDPGIGLHFTGSLTRWLGVLVLLGKTMALLFVMIWLRWSLPRFRVDKVMYLCYKVLLPWSIVCVVGAALQVLLGHALPDGAFAGWLMGR
jgi:NADH-quinone oxidoreductase subunit H